MVYASELGLKYLTEHEASLKTTLSNQVSLMYLSELENVLVKLGHMAINIRA